MQKERPPLKSLGDIQFSDRDVLLSASLYSEQMLNGLIDRNS